MNVNRTDVYLQYFAFQKDLFLWSDLLIVVLKEPRYYTTYFLDQTVLRVKVKLRVSFFFVFCLL